MKLEKTLNFIECILYFNEQYMLLTGFFQAAYGIRFSFAFCNRNNYVKIQIELRVG